MIQVLLGKSGGLDSDGNELPRLVYVSREKRPGFQHHKKAGAMNSLVRVSGVLTNGPFMLNLDCDHYINNSKALREAMCFLMDPNLGKYVCYVQFPQRFDGIDRSDRYANRNTVFFDIILRGLDGIQGPVYVCSHGEIEKEKLIGNITNFSDWMLWMAISIVNQFELEWYLQIEKFIGLTFAPLVVKVDPNLNVIYRSVKPTPPSETMSNEHAMRFPLVGSAMLLSLFLLFKFLSKDLVNAVLTCYFIVLGIVALSATLLPAIKRFLPNEWNDNLIIWRFPYIKALEVEFTKSQVVAAIPGAFFCAWYASKKHWLANNFMGLAFSI